MSPVSNSPSAPAEISPPAAPLHLRRSPRETVLAYHELSPEATDYSYALSCGQFEKHLQLADQLRHESSSHRLPLVISFDDGHISNYTHALPLLERYSCKAIFFVIVGRISEQKDFMGWAQLRELVARGHTVASHSWSHKFLTGCSDPDLRDELMRSRQTLEDRLACPVQAISAPHGRWNGRVLRACSLAGYRQLYTSDPWPPARSMKNVEVMGRLVMLQSMDASALLNWITMSHIEASLRRARHALKRSVRRVLGNKLYYHLWARLSGWNGPADTILNG